MIVIDYRGQEGVFMTIAELAEFYRKIFAAIDRARASACEDSRLDGIIVGVALGATAVLAVNATYIGARAAWRRLRH